MVGYCDDGVSAGIWFIHTGPKSGGELVTLFGGFCDDGVSAGTWVIHTGPKSGGELVTLFGVHCDDAVSAGIWVLHTGLSARIWVIHTCLRKVKFFQRARTRICRDIHKYVTGGPPPRAK